jgi:hypothetical protein
MTFPTPELVRLAGEGFDWIWFLGVWHTGPAGRKVSFSHEGWQAECRQLLPDFQEEDVVARALRSGTILRTSISVGTPR